MQAYMIVLSFRKLPKHSPSSILIFLVSSFTLPEHVSDKAKGYA